MARARPRRRDGRPLTPSSVRRTVPHCSLSSTRYQTNKYSGLTCGGLPVSSVPGQGGCLNGSAPFFKVTCVTTTEDFPFEIYSTNSLIQRSFAPGTTCEAPGVPTLVTAIPLDTCIGYNSNSQKYSCSATTGQIVAMSYASPDCSGTGSSPSTKDINTCVKFSSDSSPSDFSCSSATSSLTPVITQPSSAFLPPPISGSSELLACTDKATLSSSGYNTRYCGSKERYCNPSTCRDKHLASLSMRAAALALAAPYTPALKFLSHRR